MMTENPRIGFILIRSEWFDRPESADLLNIIDDDAQQTLSRLRMSFDVAEMWIIDSLESLLACQVSLRGEQFDFVLIAFQTWGEDSRLVALLQALTGTPIVLWAYLPWRRVPRPATLTDMLRASGPVGMFGALGTLRNLEVPFLFTYGASDDPRFINDLTVAGRAARVRRLLRSARFGLLPSRNDQIQSTFVDEFRLMADFGPTVYYLSVGEYRRVVELLDPSAVDQGTAKLKQDFRIEGVSDSTLRNAAAAALGLARMAEDYRLSVLAINDFSPELHHAFKMRPGLHPSMLCPSDALFQPEGDLGAATANFILHHLTNSPTILLEIWFWDEAKNRIYGAHAGVQDPAIADPHQVWIGPDFEYQKSNPTEGAQIQLAARHGRVTLFQLRTTPKGWQAIAMSGMCLESQPWIEGYPHAVIRLDAPVDVFLRRISAIGSTQHWLMAYGSVLPEIEAFCALTNLPLEKIVY